MISFEIPRALQPHANGSPLVRLDRRCATVRDALAALGDACPGVLDRVVTEQGDVRPHVNVFVGDESIRFLDGLDTPLPTDTTISIVPAVSGG